MKIFIGREADYLPGYPAGELTPGLATRFTKAGRQKIAGTFVIGGSRVHGTRLLSWPSRNQRTPWVKTAQQSGEDDLGNASPARFDGSKTRRRDASNKVSRRIFANER